MAMKTTRHILPPDVEFHDDVRLLVWIPRGMLNRAAVNKIITVIGCGGDRDKAKRPLMAKIACELSSKVILTSDNPRSENPEDIIRQMEAGVEPMHKKKVLSIVDRKEAIKTACAIAEPGDIILVAGKGHEKYQEIKGEKLPFDDKELLKNMFTLMYH